MAKYEDLFPNADPQLKEPFLPIRPTALPGFGASMGARVRRAINAGEDPAQQSGDIDDLLNSVRGLAYKAPEGGSTTFGDYARAAGAGAIGVGSMLAGAAEYGARALAGDGETPFEQAAIDVTQSLTGARQRAAQAAQRMVSSMTPEAQARLAREWTTLDPSRTIWQGDVGEFISSLSLQAAQALPSSLVTLIPAGLALRAGMRAGGLSYLGASEAVLSTGSIASNIAAEIEEAPEEELMESQRYQQLRRELGDVEARQQLIREAQGYAPVVGGAIVGLIGRQTGKYLEPVFTSPGGRGALGRFGVGFASEAPQEASQSAIEQAAQNIAAQIYDSGRVWDEGVLEAAVQGGAVGGLIGGGVTTLLGQRPASLQPLGTPAPPSPDAGPVKTDDVPEDVRAALAASEAASREEADLASRPAAGPTGQFEMFGLPGQEDTPAFPSERGMDPAAEAASYQRRPWPVTQQEMDLPQATGNDRALVPQPTQLPLFRERRRGRAPEALIPMSAQPATPDMTPPAEADLAVRPRLETLPLTKVPAKGKTRAAKLRLRALEERQNQLAAQEAQRAELGGALIRDEAQLDLFEPEPGVSEVATSRVTGTRGGGQRQLIGFVTRAYNPSGGVIAEDVFETADEANTAADEFAQKYPEAVVRVDRSYTRAAGTPVITTTTRQEFAGDEPTAEPLTDIQAQLRDLQDPDSGRKGVYLSRLNIEGLRRAGVFEQVRGVGIPLANFDRKGGTLIAKDRATAKELIDLRDAAQSDSDMQEVLGYATGAGRGKPAGGSIVVQQRDETGGVTRESLVASQEEADRLAAEWEAPGRETFILSLPAAMRRRAQKLAAEREAAEGMREWRKTARDTRQLVEEELGDDTPEAESVLRLIDRPSIGASRTRAARRVLDYAATKEKASRAARVDGFDLPRLRKFATRDLDDRYKELWDDYVAALTRKEMATTAEATREAEAAAADLRELLIAFVRSNRSTTPSERLARLARRLSPEAAEAYKRSRTVDADEAVKSVELESITDDMPVMTRAEIRKLSGERLNIAFMRAANYLSGLRKRRTTDSELPASAQAAGADRVFRVVGKSVEDLAQQYKTPSERKKLIMRAQSMKRARQWTTISKGRGLTNRATKESREYRRSAGDELPLDPLVVENETTRLVEASAADRIKFLRSVRDARSVLRKALNESVAIAESLQSGEYAEIATEKDGNGLTDDARDAIYGRAYLQTLIGYARALLSSRANTPAMLRALKATSKSLESLQRLDARGLARKLGGLMSAESRENTLSAYRADKTTLKGLNIPERRAVMTAATNTRVAAAARFEKRWKKNLFFNRTIAPYMRLLVDYVMSNGEAGGKRGVVTFGRPTRKGAEEVRLALQKLRAAPETRSEIYVPLRKWFEEMGFKFENGDLVVPTPWEIPNEMLIMRRYNRRFGVRNAPTLAEGAGIATTASPDGSELVAPFTPGASPADMHALREQRVRRIIAGQQITEAEARARVRAEETAWMDSPAITAAGIENVSKAVTVNKAIEKLRKDIQRPKATTLDILAAEERLAATLKQAGMWSAVGVGKQFARITLPNKSITVRLVGPRLRNGTFTVAEARQAMLDLYKPIPLNEETLKTTDAAATGARAYEQAERQRRASYKKAERNRRANMTIEQRKAIEALERQDRGGTTLALIEEAGSYEDFSEAGRSFADLMTARGNAVPLNDALITLWRSLRSNSEYGKLAQRILDLNMDVEVVWVDNLNDMAAALGTANGSKVKGTFRFGNGLSSILLNREWFDRAKAEGKNADAMLTHVLLHEAVHAATVGKLARDQNLRYMFEMLRGLAQREALRRNLGNPYGVTNAYEFVAEAFSNPKFQEFLASVRIDSQQTLWQKFLRLLRDLLGLPSEPRIETVLDAVMATADTVFAGMDTRNLKAGQLHLDAATASKIDNVINKLMRGRQVRDILSSQVADAKENASTGILAAMTMEQIRDFFGRHFQLSPDATRAVDRNPLNEYWRAFTERNAMNSELMERADKLSREWTKLAEQSPEEALELSRLMTEATLEGIHPNLPLSDKRNEHITHPEKKKKHAELAARFAKLGDGAALYSDISKYYLDTLQREVNLQTLNALRAVLTSGKDGMSKSVFDAMYTEESIAAKKLNTKAGLRAEFPEDILTDADLSTIVRIASVASMWKGPYFPLSRFGDYSVYAEKVVERKNFTNKDDAKEYRDSRIAADSTLDAVVKETDVGFTVEVKEIEYRMAETRTEADKARREMIERYGAEAVTPVQLRSQAVTRETAIAGDRGLSSILNKLGDNDAAKAAIKNFYLRALADGSFRKHEVNRQNRRGVDYDLQHRAFANYAKSASYYTAQLKHGWRMAEAKAKMREVVRQHRDESRITAVRMAQIEREIAKRDEMTVDPNEVGKFVRRGTTFAHFLLLTSPSYWLINATQPYTVLLPWLGARGGYSQAVAALSNAQKLIASPLISEVVSSWGGVKALFSKVAAEKAFTVLDQVEDRIRKSGDPRRDDYLDMLTQLKRQSIIDLSFVAELRQMAEGESDSLTSKVLDASRIMSHLTEVNNRIISALAAYDVARARALPHQRAVDFAKQAVSMTQFNYSAGNKPRLFQEKGPLGAAGPLMFQFMQYPQHMYALMIGEFMKAVRGGQLERKTAVKTLAGVFMTHLVAAGVLGAAVQPIKWALGAMMAAFDDEDDRAQDVLSGDKFDQVFREVATELFGEDAGLLLSKGVPAALGADVSDRMTLGTLYFVDLKPENAESLLGSIMMTFGGPLPGIAAGWFKGFQEISKGELARASEFFFPKAVKDLFQTVRFAREGVTSASGATLLADERMTEKELFFKSLGFQPTLVSEAYAAQGAIKRRQQTDQEARTRLTNIFLRANTPEEREAARRAIMEFNKNAPTPITYATLMRSRARAQERDQNIARYGADLRGRQVRYAEEGEAYLTE